MRLEQANWTAADGLRRTRVSPDGGPAQLVLVFGDRFALARREIVDEPRAPYRGAKLLGCSTPGEIRDARTRSARCELPNQTMTVTTLSEN